jgi:hypothetical protein
LAQKLAAYIPKKSKESLTKQSHSCSYLQSIYERRSAKHIRCHRNIAPTLDIARKSDQPGSICIGAYERYCTLKLWKPSKCFVIDQVATYLYLAGEKKVRAIERSSAFYRCYVVGTLAMRPKAAWHFESDFYRGLTDNDIYFREATARALSELAAHKSLYDVKLVEVLMDRLTNAPNEFGTINAITEALVR